MSDRNRDVTTALAITLVIALAWALGVWNGTYNEARRSDYHESEAKPYSGGLDADTFWKTHAGTSKTYRAICASPIDGDQADLCQQWQSAEKSKEIAGYTAASLVVGIIGIVGLAFTVVYARGAVLETRRIGEAQVRAYLTIVAGEFIVTQSGVIQFRIQVQNVGNSPSPECETVAQATSPRVSLTEISAVLDYSDPVSLKTFSIPTGLTWSRWLTIPTPFSALATQYLYEGWSLVTIEAQLRWKDVFDRVQIADFLLIEVIEAGTPQLNSDSPPSRRGKLNVYTQRPNDQA